MNLKRGCLAPGLSVILVIFISGCAQQENSKSGEVSESANKSRVEIQEPLPSTANKGLGALCSGEDECVSFCLNNRGRCESYCKGNTENKLCRIIFPSGGTADESNILTNSGKCVLYAAQAKKGKAGRPPKVDEPFLEYFSRKK